MKTLILSADDIAKYANAKLAIHSVDYVFTEFGNGSINLPPKIHVDMSKIGHESWCNAMPAYLAGQQIGGMKWIGGFGNNQAANLPYIMGVVILTDPTNGHVLSIMDGRQISDLRTGASAAVFTRYLAVSPLNDILVVGAGAQGKTAVECLLLEYPEAKIMVYDLNRERIEILKNSFPNPLNSRIIPVDNLENSARKSKLIVLLTTSKQPFMKNEWVSEGATVLGMGTYQQVFEEFTLSADKIVTDCWAQAIGRSELKPLYATGKITHKDCYAEIGEIAIGSICGRENDEERIMGLPLGIGAHDVCMAYHIYKSATENKDGSWVELQ